MKLKVGTLKPQIAVTGDFPPQNLTAVELIKYMMRFKVSRSICVNLKLYQTVACLENNIEQTVQGKIISKLL